MPKTRSEENKIEKEKEIKAEFVEGGASVPKADVPVRPTLDVVLENTEIPAKRWPDIRAGICEFCGVMNKSGKDDEAWHQYRYCPHYKGVEVKCIYCPAGTDMEDVIKGRIIKVRERLDRPGVLTMWCSDMKCENAHWKRVGGSQRPI